MTAHQRPRPERLLTPGEVAAIFRVHARSVTRWAKAGKLSATRTPGGHHRFRESDVRALLASEGGEVAAQSVGG